MQLSSYIMGKIIGLYLLAFSGFLLADVQTQVSNERSLPIAVQSNTSAPFLV